jgi:UDP-N-acetylmuramyl pentapeptide phosphotransferase/UDP-N-acetylglucosamine-1-phosphate transferase
MWWNSDLLIILSFSLSFIIVYISIPSVVSFSNIMGFFDKPGQRKSHTSNTPNLGGVATFAAIIISLALFTKTNSNSNLIFLFASMTILFFIGVKDDILVIAPDKKLIGELFAILILVMLGDMRFSNLHGFMGINHLPYLASVLLTVFVMIVIINAFNLIDGIDGLASGLGILIAATFGTWFYLTGNMNYTILCACVVGAYLSFFGYNVFGAKNKIFMGDTGSLMLGLLISILVIRFNEDNIGYTGAYYIPSAPAVSFGILIVPMFDTLRVFIIRIMSGQSPFRADKNHLHHRLLLLGFSHIKSTLIITTVNAVFILLVLIFKWIGIIPLMFINFGVAISLMMVTEFYIKKNYKEPEAISSFNQFENISAKSA